MNTRFWLVGGAVRDIAMGLTPKDLDFVAEAESLDAMREAILAAGGEIFLEQPEHFTIRAKVGNAAADFVLARKDGVYSDGRRPDSVEPGTLDDDLARRDFTVNAMAIPVVLGDRLLAEVKLGSLPKPYDPYGGEVDLRARRLRAVGNAEERLAEDPLRALRAIRFFLTKGLNPDQDLWFALSDFGSYLKGVSAERIREEIDRCCRAPGGFAALAEVLNDLPSIRIAVYTAVGFKPTLEPSYRREA